MKKALFFFVACCFAISCYAQEHLSFMGIPITGTITSFQNKLIAKGCTLLKNNKILPTGVRGFKGVFAGKDCEIFVWFNNRTKIVYSMRAVTDSESDLDEVHNTFYYFKNRLSQKYLEIALSSDMLEDDKKSEYEYSLLVIQQPVEEGAQILGSIDVHIIDYDGLPATHSVAVTYTDFKNSSKNEQDTIDDL